MECILRKIFTFVTLEETTFEQYLKQYELPGYQNDSLKLPIKRSQSDNLQKSIEKFDLFESI